MTLFAPLCPLHFGNQDGLVSTTGARSVYIFAVNLNVLTTEINYHD